VGKHSHMRTKAVRLTLPLISYTVRGLERNVSLMGWGKTFAFYSRGSAWDSTSVQGVGVARVMRVMGCDMFMSTQVATLPPCSPSLPAVRPLDGPQGEDGWRLKSSAAVTCAGLR
jgi:hypothetical protein